MGPLWPSLWEYCDVGENGDDVDIKERQIVPVREKYCTSTPRHHGE